MGLCLLVLAVATAAHPVGHGGEEEAPGVLGRRTSVPSRFEKKVLQERTSGRGLEGKKEAVTTAALEQGAISKMFYMPGKMVSTVASLTGQTYQLIKTILSYATMMGCICSSYGLYVRFWSFVTTKVVRYVPSFFLMPFAELYDEDTYYNRLKDYVHEVDSRLDMDAVLFAAFSGLVSWSWIRFGTLLAPVSFSILIVVFYVVSFVRAIQNRADRRYSHVDEDYADYEHYVSGIGRR